MKKDVEDQKNLILKQATVEEILVDGIRSRSKNPPERDDPDPDADPCSGTFLNGLVHIGLTHSFWPYG